MPYMAIAGFAASHAGIALLTVKLPRPEGEAALANPVKSLKNGVAYFFAAGLQYGY